MFTWSNLFPKRFELLKIYILIFITISFILRSCLTVWYFPHIDSSIFAILKVFLIGFLFDVGTISFFAVPYALYLLVIPKKWYGSVFDKVITYFGYSVGLLIFIFLLLYRSLDS